jgi:hypothetical protein
MPFLADARMAGAPPPAPDAMVAAMWSDVLAFLQTARFVDLLLPGWIDRTGPFPVCRPLTLAFGVYLQAESGLIQFTSVNGNGGLHIRQVDQFEYDEDLRNDPDEELAAASVGAHCLTASGPGRCTAMRLFTNNESVPEDGIFRAAEMTFEDTYTVFSPRAKKWWVQILSYRRMNRGSAQSRPPAAS